MIGDKIEVLPCINGDPGYVRLVDHMGNDLSIVRSARVSYNADWRSVEENSEKNDEKLINYLWKNRHCVTSDTKILTRDLRWIPAGELTLNQELIGFDEMPGIHNEEMTSYRSFKRCFVTSTGKKEEDVYEISFDDGTSIKCTGDHRWVSCLQRNGKTKGGINYNWYRTDYLLSILKKKRILFPKICDMWKIDETYGAGLLAGAWDADGCLSRRNTTSRLQFAQYQNSLLNNVREELEKRNFTSSIRWSMNRSKKQNYPISALSILGGSHETMRFLGSVRPSRLLDVWNESALDDKKVISYKFVSVTNIEKIGKREITLLGTNTETYIAEGFMAHNTSPFESVVFTFEVKAPIFVFRQWHRHRTWSYNEISARYTELDEGYYVPERDKITTQSTSNKQMRTDIQNEFAEDIVEDMVISATNSFDTYKQLLERGCPRELARSVLPVSTYSRMFATVDLHNLFHFIGLRSHEHAQYEIRVYSDAMLELIKPIVPIAVTAFKNNK